MQGSFERLLLIWHVRRLRNLIVVTAIGGLLLAIGLGAGLFKFYGIAVGSSIVSAVLSVFALFLGYACARLLRMEKVLLAEGALEYRPCSRLGRWMDLIPGKKIRKRVTKYVADEVEHSLELHAEGRIGAARWIAFCAWVGAFYLVLVAPVTAMVGLMTSGPKKSA